ncbi:RICIN domain-containing protein [Streptomyces sp. NPDC006798]|uniref:RICIN domain-containing protein n=1 Tax=Streptomyces sp. NPDC006798 TaxID=3155462 RepID=UPI0033D92C81
MARFKDLDATFEAPDGELYISLASHPNLVWDMPRFSTTAGTTPILYTRNNGANQRWRFEIHHAGTVYTFFNIINVHSGLALALQPDNTISQQVRVNPSSQTQQQSWVMGYPGSRGNTFEPARPAEPHPTGSTGTRLRVHGARGGGGPVDAAHAVSGTPITLNLWENFETGWTFTAAT